MAPGLSQITAFLQRNHLFRGVDDERMAAAAALFELVEKPAGAVIYEQESDVKNIYFLYSGKVQVTRFIRQTQELEIVGALDDGDYFGLDLLDERGLRLMTVQAVSEVILLVLPGEKLQELINIVPEIYPRMQLAQASMHLSMAIHLDWVDPEEYVHYICRKHVLFLWVRLIPAVIFGGLLFTVSLSLLPLLITSSAFLISVLVLAVLIVAAVIWQYVDWSNDYCIITSRRLAYQEKIVLLYDSREETPLEQIQSTTNDSSQLGRILGYGDVHIRTYTGIINFSGVKNPDEVLALIQQQQKRAQTSMRRAELRAIEETIAQRIGLMPAPPPPPKPGAPAAKPSPVNRFLADLFHLRYQEGDTIQYRTHWFILLGRVLVPTLLLLAIFIGQMYLLLAAVRNSPLSSLPVGAIFLVLCMIGLIIFGWWIYSYLDWHNDIYLITGDQVVDINRKPLGTEERRAAPIKNILNVSYKRIGLIGLLLNFGTVYIRVGEDLLTFDNVFDPSEVQRVLFYRIALRSLRDRQVQADAERQRMADWISAYHRVVNPRP